MYLTAINAYGVVNLLNMSFLIHPPYTFPLRANLSIAKTRDFLQ